MGKTNTSQEKKCCNPYKSGHKFKQHRTAVQITDFDRCRALFPNFPWRDGQLLCLNCRLRMLKEWELLQIVRRGVQQAQRAQVDQQVQLGGHDRVPEQEGDNEHEGNGEDEGDDEGVVEQGQQQAGDQQAVPENIDPPPYQQGQLRYYQQPQQLDRIDSEKLPGQRGHHHPGSTEPSQQASTSKANTVNRPTVRGEPQPGFSGNLYPDLGPQMRYIAVPAPPQYIPTPTGSLVSSTVASSVSVPVSHYSSNGDEQEADDLNNTFEAINISPTRPSDIKKPSVIRRKYMRLKVKAKSAILNLSGVVASPECSRRRKCGYCQKLFRELSYKFKQQESRVEKYKVLTCIPKRFTIAEVTAATGCSNYLAKNASKLVTLQGAYSWPAQKMGKAVSRADVDIIVRFYLSDDNSRASPNKKDVIMIRQESGEKMPVEKRRLLHNLNDLFLAFKEAHGEVNVSASKFAKLRPRNCIWPGQRGHHVTCVCEIHQNFEFLLEAIGYQESVKQFVANVVCLSGEEENAVSCHLGLCECCPKTSFIDQLLNDILSDEEVTYHQWVHTDHTDINHITVPSQEFRRLFLSYVPKIVEHEYITQKQQKFIYNLRNITIKEEKAVTIQVDFAQNYTFVIQNAVQSYHWSNSQATVHPFVVHWWDSSESQLRYKTYCVISDELSHDADTFHAFRAAIFPKFRDDFQELEITKFYYISDGAAGQYKNFKNFSNLMAHTTEFGIAAEWHFTSTSHGKSTCDAISAVVKCCTRRESLRPGVFITTPLQMFRYCERKLATDKLSFTFVSKDDVDGHRQNLKERYIKFKTITGTRKQHAFKPKNEDTISIGRTSDSSMFTEISFRKSETLDFNADNLHQNGFYAFQEANNYQVGLLLEDDKEEGDAKFRIMKFNRRTRTLIWPEPLVFTNIPHRDILMQLPEPETLDGNIYSIGKDTMTAIRKAYNAYKARKEEARNDSQ